MSERIKVNTLNKKQYARMCLVNMYKKKKDIPKELYHNIGQKAPENFSLIENPVATTTYFNNMIDLVRECKDFIRVVFDLTDVENITIDAIMYMIAIAVNIQSEYRPRYRIMLPKNEKAKKFVLSSGIDDFFNTNEIPVSENNDFFTIKMGNDSDGEIARKICDFTNEKLKTDKKFTTFLYDMLIEMMTNAKQHAYNKSDKIKNQWFIFAENSTESIKYTFIDTGLGIPATMSKYVVQVSQETFEQDNQIKKLVDSFYNEINLDPMLILTGLKKGAFRTRMDESYRGKGLPEIYAYFKEKRKTSHLKIISGKCLCSFNEDDREKSIVTNFNKKFIGTLFYWEIDKEQYKEE